MTDFLPPKLHRGRFYADGIWLPPGFTGHDFFVSWEPGSQALASHGGCLLRFPRPIRVQAEECRGVPLVSKSGLLCSHDQPAKSPGINPQADFCLWWQGSLHWTSLSSLPSYPVHRHIEVQIPVSMIRAESSSSAAINKQLVEEKPADLVHIEPPKEIKKAERSWADVPEVNPMLAKLLEQAKSRAEQTAKSSGSKQLNKSQSGTSSAGWIDRVAESGLANSLANLVQRGQQYMTAWLRSAQDDYLKKMMKHFEDGNWSEALRYGIPLGGEESQILMEYMGLLKPRNQLNVTARSGVGSGIGLEGTNMDRLRLLYEKAFQDLSRQGRHVEAAFVLAELFHDSHRAVLYLEEHQLFREASDLAELRKLPADLRVRLLFKSGQHDAALALARQEGVFQQVYEVLKSLPEQGGSWLKLWCQDLCDRGQTAQALLLAWAENQEPEDLSQRLPDALNEGTYQSGQVLAEAIFRAPFDLSNEVLELHLSLWEESLDLVSDAYRGLANQLVVKRDLRERNGRSEVVCSRVCRKTISMLDEGLEFLSSSNIRTLANRGDDRWLDADLPAKLESPENTVKGFGLDCWTETIERLGFTCLHHAALLPDGRALVALGEAGLLIVSRRGKVIQRIDVPVDQIILPTQGQRYLLLSERGPYQLLHWFLPSSLQVERWCSTKLDCWAQCHDGINWWGAAEQSIYAIDINASAWMISGSFPVESANKILQMVYRDGHTRESGEMGLFVLFDQGHEQQLQLVSHKLPSLQRVRAPFAIPQPHFYQSQHLVIEYLQGQPERVLRPAVNLSITLKLPDFFFALSDLEAHSFHQSYSALKFLHPDGIVVCILDWVSRRQMACFNFVGSKRISWQWQLDRLLLTDDRGRFFIANLRHGWWDGNWCL